jgi:hypothetical protein
MKSMSMTHMTGSPISTVYTFHARATCPHVPSKYGLCVICVMRTADGDDKRQMWRQRVKVTYSLGGGQEGAPHSLRGAAREGDRGARKICAARRAINSG